MKKCNMKNVQHGNNRGAVKTPANMQDGELCNNI